MKNFKDTSLKELVVTLEKLVDDYSNEELVIKLEELLGDRSVGVMVDEYPNAVKEKIKV